MGLQVIGPTRVRTSDKPFLNPGSVTGLSDWALGEVRVQERMRYASPEDLFQHEYVRLVQALTVVAGSKETAADAVQEAFVCLIRQWERVSKFDDPAGWIRRVALNQINQHQRSLWRQARLLLKIEHEPVTPREISSFDPELWTHLRTLPPKQRTAVALRYVGGMTAREVAEVMQVSEGTIDQHLHRALQTLRARLEEQK